MASDDQRRAVAARMREIMRRDPHGFLDIMVARSVLDVMGEGVTIGETVADLIEPQADLCWNVADESEGDRFRCSECGAVWELDCGTSEGNGMHHCPGCGRRIVHARVV